MDKKLRKQERLRREQAAAAADAQRAAEYKQRKALQKQINAYGVKPPRTTRRVNGAPRRAPNRPSQPSRPSSARGIFFSQLGPPPWRALPAGSRALSSLHPVAPQLLGDPGKPLRPFPTAGALARSSPQARLTPPPLPAKAGPWCQTVACKFKGLGGDGGG
jgi:hypothetical protein